MAVPTASIGLEPDEISSVLTFTALRALFFAFLATAATATTLIVPSTQPDPLLACHQERGHQVDPGTAY